MSTLHSLEIVGRGRETQLQVDVGAGISMLCVSTLIRFYLYYKVHVY